MTARISPEAYMRKAESTLAAALRNLREHDANIACECAYYAMFNAAHAALLALGIEGISTPIKTHNGLVAKFSQEVTLPGHLPRDRGKDLSNVQKFRQVATYSVESVDLADAAWAVEHAELFVAAVKTKFRL